MNKIFKKKKKQVKDNQHSTKEDKHLANKQMKK